jgi:hypothetical protein
MMVMYRQVHEELPPLESIGRIVPNGIAAVVSRAMAKAPAERYQSARAFAGALADAAASSWGPSWPAADALRIMSVGPIETTAARSLITTPVEVIGPISPKAADTAVTPQASGAEGRTQAFQYRAPDPPPVEPTKPVFKYRAPDPPPVPVAPAPVPVVAPAPPPRPVPAPPPRPVPAPPATATAAQWQLPPDDRPARGHRGVALALVGVLIAAAVAAGFLALRKHHNGTAGAGPATTTPTRPTPTPPVTTAPPKPAQVAVDLNRLIQQSASARSLLVRTVAAIESCSYDPNAASMALATAISSRQQVIDQVGTLPVNVLSNGVAMRQALVTALTASIAADRQYQAWLAGITSAGGCKGHAAHDANWQAAQTSSSDATGAKQTFATLWNPVAATFGQPTVTSATI